MSALVSTNGRMFYIMDEGSRISIQLPPKWKLIARDAFNGTILWKRDIATWQSHLWPLKSGPTQLSRRLVSTDEIVYARSVTTRRSPHSMLHRTIAARVCWFRRYRRNNSYQWHVVLVVRKGKAELADLCACEPDGR